jgi:hypothetical protein
MLRRPIQLLLPALLLTLPDPAQGQSEGSNPAARASGPARGLAGDSVGLAEVEGGLLGIAGNYEVRFDQRGPTFVPVLGASAPTDQVLGLAYRGLGRAGNWMPGIEVEPRRGAGPAAAEYQRASGLIERLELTPAGLEHSLVLEHAPAGKGDLRLAFELSGNLAPYAQRQPDGTWLFDGPYGDIHYGGLTAIDASGRRAAGEVLVQDGVLIWRVGAEFLDAASYPLTLDPLVSSPSTLVGIGNNDREAETAADELSARQLVVWKRQLSATSFVVRGQLLDFFGAPTGPLLVISSGILPDARPRVAVLNSVSRFVVSWVQNDGLIDTARAAVLDASTGSQLSSFVLDTAADGFLEAPDLCSELLAVGSGIDRVYAVWHRIGSGIRGSVIQASGAGATVTGPTLMLSATQASGNQGVLADISLQSNMGIDRKLAVGYLRRTSPTSSDYNAYMAVYQSNLAIAVGETLVLDTANPEIGIELDQSNALNFSNTWTVAVATDKPASATHDLVTRLMRLTGSSLAAVPGAPTTLIAGNLNGIGNFSVSTRPGKTLIAYETLGLLSFVNLITLDSQTNLVCDPAVIVEAVTFDSRPTVACQSATGGAVYNTNAVLLWNNQSTTPGNQQDIRFQRYSLFTDIVPNWSDLGGGCGAAGIFSLLQSGVFSIGNGYVTPNISGADPTAPVSILNIAAPQAPLPCGPCLFLPFENTIISPMFAGVSGTVLQIPCKASLVGKTVHMQYTVLTFGTSPCSSAADLSFSNRVAVTIGT